MKALTKPAGDRAGWSVTWSVIGVLVAATGIFERSLWQDEAITAGLAHGDRAGLWNGIVADRGNMALFYVIEAALAPISDSDAWLRMPSVVSFGVLVGLLWALVDRVSGSGTAHVTAMLAVTSVGLVYYSQEARSYASTAAVAVALMWSLDRALRNPSVRRWAMLASLAVVGAYLHIVILFFLPGLFLVGLSGSSPRHRRRVLGAGVFGAVGCLPLVVGIALGGDDHLTWIPPLGLFELARIAVALTGAHFFDNATVTAGVLAAAIALVATVGGAVLLIDPPPDPVTGTVRTSGLSPVGIAVAGVVLPLVLMLGVSFFSPLTAPRYYLHLVPFVLFLAAIGLISIPRSAISRGLFAGIVGLGMLRMLITFGQEDVPWQSVEEYVDATASEGDVVHSLTYWERAPFDWYHWRDGRADVVGLAPLRILDVPQHPYPDEPDVQTLDGLTVFLIEAEGDADAVEQFLVETGEPYSVLEVVSFGTATVTRVRFP